MSKPLFSRRGRLGLMMGVALAVAPLPGVADRASEQRLSFDVDEGLNLNSFLRVVTADSETTLRGLVATG